VIDWKNIINLDKRSKLTIAEQIAQGFIDLIQNQIISPNQSLPNAQTLAQTLSIPEETMNQAIALLIKNEYIDKFKQDLIASESELLKYHLPKPFTPHPNISQTKLMHLEVETRINQLIDTPLMFVERFPEFEKQKVHYSKQIYRDQQKIVAIIETYQSIDRYNNTLTQQDQVDKYETTGELTITKMTDEHRKAFGSQFDYIAKDFYMLKKTKNRLIEFGYVYTTLKHAFKKTLGDNDFLFIF
jgi:hypothetical protein